MAAVKIMDEYGQKIGMSRRDMAKMAMGGDLARRLSELPDGSRREFLEAATRDFLWPRFNWDRFNPEKHDLFSEMLAQELRKRVPEKGKEDLPAYVENVFRTMSLVRDAVREAADLYRNNPEAGRLGNIRFLRGAAKAARMMKKRIDPAREMLKRFSGGYLGGVSPDNQETAIGRLIAGAAEMWGDKVASKMLAAVIVAPDQHEKAIRFDFPAIRTPLVFNQNVWLEDSADFETSEDRGSLVLVDAAKDEEDYEWFSDLESLRRELRERLSRRRGPDAPTRPQFERLVRKGYAPDSTGRDMSVPDLVREFSERFGLRGYEFGNWLAQADRRQNVLYAMDAFADLSRALGIPENMIGRNGGMPLALAMGARGNGGPVLAHYEPARVVINLTKMKGAGALAHEWGHYLDMHVFGGRAAAEAFRALTRRAPVNEYEKVRAFREGRKGKAIERKLASIFEPAKESDEAERGLLADKKRHVMRMIRCAASAEEYADAVSEAVCRELGETRGLYSEANRILDRVPEIISEIKAISEVDTDFYRNAKKHGRYWASPAEMWARAFESHIHEEMESRGLRNDYLVALYRHELSPYPSCRDAEQVHGAVTDVLDRMRRKFGLDPFRDDSEFPRLGNRPLPGNFYPRPPAMGDMSSTPWDKAAGVHESGEKHATEKAERKNAPRP